MSIWYNPKKEDIEINEDGEIDINFKSDMRDGNHYVSIKITDIIALLTEKNLI